MLVEPSMLLFMPVEPSGLLHTFSSNFLCLCWVVHTMGLWRCCGPMLPELYD